MTDFPNLSAELTKSLTSLWTRYAGKRPTNGQTEIRGNVVTCQLTDAVGDFNRSMISPQTRDSMRGVGNAESGNRPWPTTRKMQSLRWWE
jgi:hypothetical protein